MRITDNDFIFIKKRLLLKRKDFVRIVSDSMVPLIDIGDNVEVTYLDNLDDIKRFDIIIFHLGEVLTSHFYWGRNLFEPEKLLFKSLKHVKDYDLPISEQSILGKVNLTFPLWLKLIVYLSLFINRSK